MGERGLEQDPVLERVPQLLLEDLVPSGRRHAFQYIIAIIMNLACLKCTSVLDKARVDEIEVDVCPRCGGLWLDHGELERLSRKQASEIERLRKLLAPRKGPPPVASDLTSSCPACTGKMREVKLSALTIDYCTRCKGLFLDRGEIDIALKAIKDSKATMPMLVAASVAEQPLR